MTDNRLYLHGDVNVRADNTTGVVTNSVAGTSARTNQDIAGRISFLADSITIQSEAFDDRMRAAARFDSFHRRPVDFVAFAIALWTVGSAAGVDVGGAPDHCSTAVGDTAAVATRVNASLLMGDVPACVDAGDSDGNKSGGINNFPRFVEDWQGVTMVINGSMVGLFRAERGNSRFRGSGFSGSLPTTRSSSAYNDDDCTYFPPTRLWSFDDALLGAVEALPPGTPRVVSTDRLRWIRR